MAADASDIGIKYLEKYRTSIVWLHYTFLWKKMWKNPYSYTL